MPAPFSRKLRGTGYGPLSERSKPLQRRHGTKPEIVSPYNLITREEIDSILVQRRNSKYSPAVNLISMMPTFMIALLDGSQVDDGTAWEIGYFYAKESPEQKIIGIRTDFRRAGESEGAMMKDYASYCTSLARSGINSANGCLSPSFLPWHLVGLSVPGGSKRCSFLSLQANP